MNIGLGFSELYGAISRYSRSVARVHELTHALIFRHFGLGCSTEMHEGIAKFAHQRYSWMMETYAWVEGMPINDSYIGMMPAKNVIDWEGYQNPGDLFGEITIRHNFFGRLAEKIGAPDALRCAIYEPPRNDELSLPQLYLKRMKDVQFILSEELEETGSG